VFRWKAAAIPIPELSALLAAANPKLLAALMLLAVAGCFLLWVESDPEACSPGRPAAADPEVD